MLFFTAWRFIQRRMTVDLARESSDARKQSPGNRPSRPTNAGPGRAPPGPPLVSGCFDWAPCWETVNPLLHPVARRFVVSGNARAGFNVHEKNHKLFCLWRDVTHEVRSTSQTTARQGEHSRSSQLPRCIYSREKSCTLWRHTDKRYSHAVVRWPRIEHFVENVSIKCVMNPKRRQKPGHGSLLWSRSPATTSTGV